jgi:hypothetical protein
LFLRDCSEPFRCATAEPMTGLVWGQPLPEKGTSLQIAGAVRRDCVLR